MRFSPRRSPAAAAGGALTAAFSVIAMGCSNPQSFIVLVIESAAPTPITNVAQLTVVVSKGTTEMKTLSYGAGDLTLVADADTSSGTLSVGFSGGETGDVTFDVTASDAQGCTVGHGGAIVTIKKGAVNEGIVPLTAGTGCARDGGGPDGGPGGPDASDGGPFGGCDLVSPQCPANQTCQVDCTTMKNECLTSGAVAAGGACQSGADCAPGTQCFDYKNVGCTGTKICLPFCGTNADCAAFGAAGTGPGSACRDPVICPTQTTPAHTCTFNCDPTAAARTAGSSGCPSGLACLMTASMDAVDCACPEVSRTGQEGAPCASSATCAPGLICNTQGGVQNCRAVCRCDAVSAGCTAANDCPTANTHCTFVTNQTIYGICL